MLKFLLIAFFSRSKLEQKSKNWNRFFSKMESFDGNPVMTAKASFWYIIQPIPTTVCDTWFSVKNKKSKK